MSIGKSERAETKTFRLSDRLSVGITVGPLGMVCEWDPNMPRKLNQKETRAYIKGRDEMLGRLATMTGVKVGVIGSDGKITSVG